ncbi:hypothetical protein HDU96_001306 [Phlyctochytrium bullatum]|nr:hypothetical protein HDU96_001306 [Phlyctochytrium bullatum]
MKVIAADSTSAKSEVHAMTTTVVFFSNFSNLLRYFRYYRPRFREDVVVYAVDNGGPTVIYATAPQANVVSYGQPMASQQQYQPQYQYAAQGYPAQTQYAPPPGPPPSGPAPAYQPQQSTAPVYQAYQPPSGGVVYK